MAEEQNNNAQQEPVVSEEEMKMPEENFGASVGGDENKEPSHLGVILSILIVILVLLLGALYLWSTTFKTEEVVPTPVAERPTAEENNEPESTTAEAQVQTLQTVSTSDEINAIDADVESTNIDNIDAELNAIDAELNTALQ